MPREYCLQYRDYTTSRQLLNETFANWMTRTITDVAVRGVFGIKMMRNQYDMEIRTWRRFRVVFPGARVVYLTRQNVLLQAISFSFASSTGIWKGPYPVVKKFNVETVKESYRQITTWNRAWRKTFRRNHVPYLPMSYEQLIGSPGVALVEICKYLALPLPTRIDLGTFQKQMTREVLGPVIDRLRNDEGCKKLFGHDLEQEEY